MKTEGRWDTLAKELRALTRDDVERDEPMARHTTIGVGGPARLLVRPRTAAEVARAVRFARASGVPCVAVGKGSNLIVRDAGFEGLVLLLDARLTKVAVGKRTVRAQGGASFARMCRNLTRAGRTGLEFGVGIPGTVGGAVRMNAGAFGGEVSEVLRRVRYIDGEGELRTLPASAIEFAYRRCSLPADAVVVEATFACPPGEVNMEAYRRALDRKKTQPIWERTFGSTFVNPATGYAARMIEGCGLKGRRMGGAMISDMHANFIVNVDGHATARDVEGLIELMQAEVHDKYGVDLETEVVIIGDR